MIDYQDIEAEIAKIESEETTYSNCSKLAVLYSILDHRKDTMYLSAPDSESEFIRVCTQHPSDRVLSVLDEHMDAIKLLYPKEYTAIIAKIEAL